MLLLPEKRIIFYTPPKCSSTTIINVLTREAGARLEHGPQGPWKIIGHFNYRDCTGKHTVIEPWISRNWKKYIFYRHPFDRFISLWKHYVKHTNNDVSFEAFVDMVEENVTDIGLWFYTWKMGDIINDAPKDCGIIQHNDLGMVNKILNTNYTFPVLNSTVHDNWYTYYTPELYRRVHNLA